MKNIGKRLKARLKILRKKTLNSLNKIKELQTEKRIEVEINPKNHRIRSLLLGFATVIAIYGLTIIPVNANEIPANQANPAPKGVPTPEDDHLLSTFMGVGSAVCARAIGTGYFVLGFACGLVVVGGLIYKNSK
jgi:hypothetical protein